MKTLYFCSNYKYGDKFRKLYKSDVLAEQFLKKHENNFYLEVTYNDDLEIVKIDGVHFGTWLTKTFSYLYASDILELKQHFEDYYKFTHITAD